MQLYYEGTDITNMVDVTKCIHRDVSDGRSDAVELEVENAAVWYRWGPKQDDRLEIVRDGYSTGVLYLNTILPRDGKYRMIATSTPSAARRKANASYENISLFDLMAVCGAECKMGNALHGIDGNIPYPYIVRRNESAPAFLSRILHREGAVLKAYNGKLIGIGILYAQGLNAAQTIEMAADQRNAHYVRRENGKLGGMTILSPYAQSSAWDKAAVYGQAETRTDLPAMDKAEAGRWARGLLLKHNRQMEEMSIATEFQPGYTAMMRIDIQSNADFGGEWLVDEVEHDLWRGKSKAKLLRCINTIA